MLGEVGDAGRSGGFWEKWGILGEMRDAGRSRVFWET